MDFNHNNVRLVVEEDRLSSLPDELIHKILSCFDMKYAVQTCLLSPRWKLLWTSMTCLKFHSGYFGSSPKFAKFVTHVLSHRNHQIEVSSVKIHFHGKGNQVLVKKIANYAFSHNVQELTIVIGYTLESTSYPPSLFSSRSLKHLTLTCNFMKFCGTPKPPLNFPALTSLNLSDIVLCGDIFSECVNLKNLTLKHFSVVGTEGVFDIITPCLSNLILTNGHDVKVMNVIAPQLENLTISYCRIGYLNAPSGLSSLSYTLGLHSYDLVQFSNDEFHSLNKVSICLDYDLYRYNPNRAYKEENAHKTINILHEFHKLRSARYLTLNADIVECISSFPDLVLHHPSPFTNLTCLTIDYSMREYVSELTISNQARNFLLENSPTASLIMKLPNQGTIIRFIYSFLSSIMGW